MTTTRPPQTTTTENHHNDHHKPPCGQNRASRWNYEELFDEIIQDSVRLKTEDWCYTHHQYCTRVPTCGKDGELVLLTAGSPCPDWSAFGKRGKYGGAAAPAFVTLSLAFNRVQ